MVTEINLERNFVSGLVPHIQLNSLLLVESNLVFG